VLQSQVLQDAVLPADQLLHNSHELLYGAAGVPHVDMLCSGCYVLLHTSHDLLCASTNVL
jgi:hypothetical protein